jgi:hypothetical protein
MSRARARWCVALCVAMAAATSAYAECTFGDLAGGTCDDYQAVAKYMYVVFGAYSGPVNPLPTSFSVCDQDCVPQPATCTFAKSYINCNNETYDPPEVPDVVIPAGYKGCVYACVHLLCHPLRQAACLDGEQVTICDICSACECTEPGTRVHVVPTGVPCSP